MIRKAVQCLNDKCGLTFHQLVSPTDVHRDIVVDRCMKCKGEKTRMHFSPLITIDREKTVSAISSSSVYEGFSSPKISLAHQDLIRNGHYLIGFTGCSGERAQDYYNRGFDPNRGRDGSKLSRGAGIYVCNKYNGLPKLFSNVHHDTSKIVRIYVSGFNESLYPNHYDWGRMDGDDLEDLGREMVLKHSLFSRMVALPAIGPQDDALVWDGWEKCPADAYSSEERKGLRDFFLTQGWRPATLDNLVRATDIITAANRPLTDAEQLKFGFTASDYERLTKTIAKL